MLCDKGEAEVDGVTGKTDGRHKNVDVCAAKLRGYQNIFNDHFHGIFMILL